MQFDLGPVSVRLAGRGLADALVGLDTPEQILARIRELE
jgi:hypothetical protein